MPYRWPYRGPVGRSKMAESSTGMLEGAMKKYAEDEVKSRQSAEENFDFGGHSAAADASHQGMQNMAEQAMALRRKKKKEEEGQ